MSIDVVGYCRMVEMDEVGTFHRMLATRAAIASLLVDFGGRIVDATGDNILAELADADSALNCAIQIQQHMKVIGLGDQQAMQLRIGIHSGALLASDGTIYGDVVNVSARLQSLASPNGILLSGALADELASPTRTMLEDLGHRSLRNISHAVRILQPAAERA